VPTDIIAAVERRRRASRQFKATIGVLGVCLVVCLVNVMLLFIDRSLARALELWANPGAQNVVCGQEIALCSRAAAP
jgi:hypothetical protein